jgi:dTDP-4-dehydrorhamnose 3,5-epimerase
VTLSGDGYQQYYIPEGFAHGFSVLSDVAEVEYKCTDIYDAPGQLGLAWNDSDLSIPWGVDVPILSERDRRNPTLREAHALLPLYTISTEP